MKYGDDLHYGDNASSIETSITIVHPDTDERKGLTFDNMTSAIQLICEYDLKIIEEKLSDRPDITIPEGERELKGTEGTEFDGLTGQAVMDAWRSRQGDRLLEIFCEGDPSLIDSLNL